MTNLPRLLLVFAVATATMGCGSKKCDITGTITRDGQPLVWNDDGGFLLVIFIPENRGPDDDVYRAETVRDTGAFKVTGIPSGKYLVAIQQFDDKHADALGHRYNPGATDLRREVTDSGQSIDIDLPRDIPKVSAPMPAVSFKKPDRPRRDRTPTEKPEEGPEIGPPPREVTGEDGATRDEK